jgi:tripeptidyl-peptidase-1
VLVAPHAETVDAVHAWLAHHDIPQEACHRTDAGDWLTVTLSVEQAKRMLGTFSMASRLCVYSCLYLPADAQYEVYAHPESGSSVVRTLGYSLPRELLDHINVVTPTTYFSTMRTMRTTSFVKPAHAPAVDDGSRIQVAPGSDATVPSSCSSTITPACLRALYNTSSYTPAATAKTSFGIAGYLEEYANDADLQVRTALSVHDGCMTYAMFCPDVLQQVSYGRSGHQAYSCFCQWRLERPDRPWHRGQLGCSVRGDFAKVFPS